MTAIEASSLVVSFRLGFWGKRFFALKGIDLKIQKGQTYALVGPNGAGKSTFIRTLLGFLKPTQGTLKILGTTPKKAILSGKIGYAPENPGLYPHLKGLETLLLAGSLLKLKRTEAKDQAKGLFERLGLSGHETREVKGYSKGMVQRLALGFSLMGSPELLIWDEPMSGLDPLGRNVVRRLMTELKTEGKTFLFSTHIIPDVEETCDWILLLDRGRMLGEIAPGPFLQESTQGYAIKGQGELLPEALGFATDFENGKPITGNQGGWTLKVPKEALSETIVRLSRCHASIETVEPMRPSLEDLLIERFKAHA
jgi:ABC-2 type transport system ATP-binding protein